MLTSTAMLVTHQTLQLLISQAIIFALGVLVALEGLLLLLWAFKLIALFPLMPTSSSSEYGIMINVQLSEVKSCQALRTQRWHCLSPTIEVPCCYAEEWQCKLEEMRMGPKKRKRDEMEQHEPWAAAAGQII